MTDGENEVGVEGAQTNHEQKTTSEEIESLDDTGTSCRGDFPEESLQEDKQM
jgi:hypothetical protein